MLERSHDVGRSRCKELTKRYTGASTLGSVAERPVQRSCSHGYPCRAGTRTGRSTARPLPQPHAMSAHRKRRTTVWQTSGEASLASDTRHGFRSTHDERVACMAAKLPKL